MNYLSFLPFLIPALVCAAEPHLVPHASIAIEGVTGCEILSIHQGSQRAALTCSDAGKIVVLDMSDPAKPTIVATWSLELAANEEVTSVAIHPDGERFVAAVKAGPTTKGHAQVRRLVDGKLLAKCEAGFGCDSVSITPDGTTAVICNEAEEFILTGSKLTSPEGSVTLLRFGAAPDQVEVVQIALADATGTAGMVKAEDGRFIERDAASDGAGTADFRGTEVSLDGKVAMIPMIDGKPDLLEPECSAITADSSTAWITLQENNALLAIDVKAGTIKGVYGLGTTTHPADLKEDGAAGFTSTLVALREPDGLAITPDGRFIITADEGDTDPKASKVKNGRPAGGGRTISVIDGATGVVLGDTGGDIDAAAANAGCYPDKRSPSKGSEPEMVATFRFDNKTYAVAGLERADAVALIELEDPAKPRVLSVTPLGKEHKAPEGIAVATWNEIVYVMTANEKSGTVSVLRLER
jgi:DNA-binding beta-propeller fold protein YncE